jgi:putative ABC transport system substrate-binding protein
VARAEDFAPTLARIGEARPDAMLVAAESLILSHRATVIEFAARARLPALYSFAGLVREGALLCFSSQPLAFFIRSAEYVDKILRGANPAELPVEQPTTFTLEVNLAAARAIGFEVPRAILDRADEIVE